MSAEKKAIIKKPNITQPQIELIKKTVAVGATNDELMLFLYTANKVGLDPLTRQIHFVKRGGKGVIQTGIDGYRAIAERTGQLAGIDDAVFDDESLPNPHKASVTVYRLVGGQRVAFTASARWSEYCPPAGNDFMWKKMPYLMLAKCAESLALRKAFPNDLSGIYTSEEMSQAGSADVSESKHSDMPEPEVVNPDVVYTPMPPAEPTATVGVTTTKTGGNLKTCEVCGNQHDGPYKKCKKCWRKETFGEKK